MPAMNAYYIQLPGWLHIINVQHMDNCQLSIVRKLKQSYISVIMVSGTIGYCENIVL